VLLQLIRQALPSSTYGMILFDSTTPDVTGANAWRKRCVWINTAVPATPTINIYRDTGSPGWININSVIPAGSITGTQIANATITLANMAVGGGTAGQLIRVNSGATGFEYINFSSLFTSGIVPVNSVVTSAVPAGTMRVLGSYGGAASNWFGINDLVADLTQGILTNLVISTPALLTDKAQFLAAKTGDVTAVWRYIDPANDINDGGLSGVKLTNLTVSLGKVSQSAATTGQVPTWNGSAWAPATPATVAVTKYVTPTASIPYMPLQGQQVSFTHGLAGIPQSVRVVLYCLIDDPPTNYIVGDELDAAYPFSSNGFSSDDQGTPFNLRVTASSIIFGQNDLGYPIYVASKTDRAKSVITQARWGVRAYALYIA